MLRVSPGSRLRTPLSRQVPRRWPFRRPSCASGRCRQRTRRGIPRLGPCFAIDALGVKLWAQSFLDFAVYLLVQVADSRGADPRAPQELRDVFHAAYGYPGKVHFNKRLLHGRFPAPVALDDGRLERGQTQLRYGQVDLSGGSQKLAVVMTAAVVPALVSPLMPFRVAQLRGFLVQHRVEGFLDGLPDDSFRSFLRPSSSILIIFLSIG